MWLINTEDYSLREMHNPGEDHPYAILSHTWEESEDDPLHKEVTFQDMRNLDEARRKTGWAKIERTCDLAQKHEPSLKWAWIDTCCIDKSSSSELTEAINSMFLWYRQAKVCFVYLSDLPRSYNTRNSRNHMNNFFPRCHWFTRGWTLQELIAPNEMEFYDVIWMKRGTKSNLKGIISTTTGVDISVLDDSENLSTIPIGRRMSWISKRNTKRVEDIAYCLFGIFDINMPLIYGEKEKSFIRLQTVIAQQFNDLSLFAWSVDSSNDRHGVEVQTYHGMFSPSHRYFQRCQNLITFHDPMVYDSQSFTVTNQGLEFQTPLKEDSDNGDYIMNLFCHKNEVEVRKGRLGLAAIRLVRTVKGLVRYCADEFYVTNHIWYRELSSVHVPAVISPSESRRLESRHRNAFRLRLQSPDSINIQLSNSEDPKFKDPHSWDWVTSTFLTDSYALFTGIMWLNISDGENKWPADLGVMFGFTRSLTENSDIGMAVGLQPWLALIDGKNSLVDTGEESIGDLEYLFINKNNKRVYRPTVSRLADIVRQAAQRGVELPKSAAVVCYKRVGAHLVVQRKPRLNISVSLKDVEESGVVVHEVIIRSEIIEFEGEIPVWGERIR